MGVCEVLPPAAERYVDTAPKVEEVPLAVRPALQEASAVELMQELMSRGALSELQKSISRLHDFLEGHGALLDEAPECAVLLYRLRREEARAVGDAQTAKNWDMCIDHRAYLSTTLSPWRSAL